MTHGDGHGHGDTHVTPAAHGHGHGHGRQGGAAYAPAATINELVARARDRLSPAAWDQVMGGAGTETTLRRNRAALDALALRPRILADVAEVTTATSLLGAPLRTPVVLAPIGSLDLVTPRGVGTAIDAAAAFGTVAFASGGGMDAARDLTGHGGTTVYQVYARGDRGWLLDQAALARDHGCLGICLTADVPWFGRRERDLRRQALPAGAYRRDAAGHPATWDDIDALVAAGGPPVVVKGVMSPDDAAEAVARGAAAVYVSNHGGRQLDHAEGAVAVLAEICDAVAGGADVVVDGGFLHGTDVAKALALGATAVAIGKLQAAALAAGGGAALVNALEILEDELATTLALLGLGSVAGLDRGRLRTAPDVAGTLHPLEHAAPGRAGADS